MTNLRRINHEIQNKKKVLIGSPIRQSQLILKEFLFSLQNLIKSSSEVDYFFVDDNDSEASSQLLGQFRHSLKNVTLHKSNLIDNYVRNEITHFWNEELIWKVASFKNLIIEEAIKENYDYLFLVDSDIILNPNTLEHLINLEKDIVSEIHWTQWQPNTPTLPQVWLSDQYNLFHKKRNEVLSQEEVFKRQAKFIQQLEGPGVYEVGGLCACTLISKRALLAGVNFKEIKNLSLWGEDRHFCIRAVALDFSLFVDTHFPGYHIYRGSDLKGLEEYKQKNGLVLQDSLRLQTLETPEKPILSLCMIVKNEKDNLPRCLATAKPYVDEIIVVDTGSDDGTPEIAANYGAKVRYFEWCDDFAAARNYAISQASGNWILMLDADEELVVESEDFFKQLACPSEIFAYSLTYTEVNDYIKRTFTYRTSLFRNISRLRYVSRLHEYLADDNQFIKAEYISYTSNIKIVHYGHFKEQVRQKIANRNLPILERIAREEELSLRLLHCLAGMYAEVGQIEKAEEWYTKTFERLLPNLINGDPPEDFTSVPIIAYDLGMQFFSKKDYDKANLVCSGALKWCSNFPPLNYLAGILLSSLGFPLGAAAYFNKCLQLGRECNYYKGTPFDLIFITTHPAHNLGLMYLKMGHLKEALDAFRQALAFDKDFRPSQDQIDKIQPVLELNKSL